MVHGNDRRQSPHQRIEERSQGPPARLAAGNTDGDRLCRSTETSPRDQMTTRPETGAGHNRTPHASGRTTSLGELIKRDTALSALVRAISADPLPASPMGG